MKIPVHVRSVSKNESYFYTSKQTENTLYNGIRTHQIPEGNLAEYVHKPLHWALLWEEPQVFTQLTLIEKWALASDR